MLLMLAKIVSTNTPLFLSAATKLVTVSPSTRMVEVAAVAVAVQAFTVLHYFTFKYARGLFALF